MEECDHENSQNSVKQAKTVINKIRELVDADVFEKNEMKAFYAKVDNLHEESREETSEDELPCKVCLAAMTRQDDLLVTTCSHMFHKACLKESLDQQKRCPICRHALRLNQIKKLYLF